MWIACQFAGNTPMLDERLTRQEALIAHTIEVGKLADLVVLDRDYMTVPAAEIKRIQPTITMVGGRVVYQAP